MEDRRSCQVSDIRCQHGSDGSEKWGTAELNGEQERRQGAEAGDWNNRQGTQSERSEKACRESH